MEPHGQPFDKLRVFLNIEVVPSEVEGARGLLRRRIKTAGSRAAMTHIAVALSEWKPFHLITTRPQGQGPSSPF